MIFYVVVELEESKRIACFFKYIIYQDLTFKIKIFGIKMWFKSFNFHLKLILIFMCVFWVLANKIEEKVCVSGDDKFISFLWCEWSYGYIASRFLFLRD